ncbi:ubiquitin thioesterase Otu1p [Trichomonascus vanleenenianus]|uniref:ubiquitin-specific protease OTU1 n=1 Tax=Trichomonascus vanleenenianus TaxID=2268995 RepID=UPI003ECA3AF5
MLLKIRTREGAQVVKLDKEEPTLNDLLSAIKATVTSIKAGFPPKSIDLSDPSMQLASLGIRNGDQLVVESQASSSGKTTQTTSSGGNSVQFHETKPKPKPKPIYQEDPNAPPIVECGNGFLKLRVMEDDNSCMFNAVGYDILRTVNNMFELRNIIASAIQADPVEYNDAILGKPAEEYVKWILKESSWGGAIELSILSKHFGVTIACLDVSTLQVHHFNPGQATFIAVVYSGIHYDAVALSPVKEEAPETAEFDQTVFNADETGENVLNGLKKLGKLLKDRHYYTDTATFQIKCKTCGARLTGEKETAKHAQTTGHVDFGEF